MSGKCLQFVHNQYGSLTNPIEKLMPSLRPLDRTHHHLRSGTDIQSSFPDPIRPQILHHRQLDTINTENLQRLLLGPVQSYIFSGHISQPDTQLILPFSTKRIYQRGEHGHGRKNKRRHRQDEPPHQRHPNRKPGNQLHPQQPEHCENQHSQHERPAQTSFLPKLSRYFAPRRFDGAAADSSRFQNDRRSRTDGFVGAVFFTHSGSFSGFWILF